jgi:hypothetical protein
MIGFTSIHAQTTEPGQGAYAATKAACARSPTIEAQIVAAGGP